MSKKTIVFQKPDDVLDFVNKVGKYPFDMDMKRGRFIVDAKSVLGLMNLGLKNKIELQVYNDNCEELWEDIQKYLAA